MKIRVSRSVSRAVGLSAFFLGMVVTLAGCERALVVAPTNARILLLASTNTLPLNSSTEISALVTDSTGAAVANGTLIVFSTTLGTLDPAETRTEGGRAVVRLIGGNVSGIATVNATSGSTAAAAPVIVRIGAVVGKIELTATSLANGSVDIVAQALDPVGIPVSGAIINFATTSGTLSNTTVITDINGQARTNLVALQDATVTAFSGDARATLAVRVGISGTLAVNLTANPSNPQRLDNVQFTASVTSPAGSSNLVIGRYEWDFGDGTTAITTGNTTSHIYQINGRFIVFVRVVALDGSTGFTRIELFAS